MMYLPHIRNFQGINRDMRDFKRFWERLAELEVNVRKRNYNI